MSEVKRRDFIKGASGAAITAGALAGRALAQTAEAPAAAPAAAPPVAEGAPAINVTGANEKIRVAICGLFGRGKSHIDGFSGRPDVEIVALCDVDQKILDSAGRQFETKNGRPVKLVQDMRRLLDDKDIDVVTMATPNHWHALGTIWACQAGKDVYCEKPASHSIWEGRQMVNAARKYNRVVQIGTQSRSSVALKEAFQKLHDGVIGDVYMAKGMCYKWRPAIGHQDPQPPPEGLDYDIWTGPAKMRPYTRNYHPYKWHWFWETGNGDIGNQGVHEMDKARWGLGLDLPNTVQAQGDKYLWQDDQETPNVLVTTFKYPEQKKMIVFEVRHWITNPEGFGEPDGNVVGNIFWGKDGYMVVPDYGSYEIFLGRKRESQGLVSKGGDHWGNFLDAVRAKDPKMLNCDVEEGHKSAAMCHMANISHRLGRSLNFDPATERFINDDEANAMVKREYREPFVIPNEV